MTPSIVIENALISQSRHLAPSATDAELRAAVRHLHATNEKMVNDTTEIILPMLPELVRAGFIPI